MDKEFEKLVIACEDNNVALLSVCNACGKLVKIIDALKGKTKHLTEKEIRKLFLGTFKNGG